jgi:chorismate dehydratase
MEARGIPVYDVFPSGVLAAALAGEIDAGPLPLVECFHLDERFRLLSGFCLASIRQVRSIALHSKSPIQELSGARIAIPEEGVTSVRLLQVLLTLKYAVQPAAYVALSDASDACLLIGHEGLRQRFGMPGHPYLYDLGEEWYQWTGLPFVFARWIVRRTADRQDVAVLEDTLYGGLQDWADGLFRPSESREGVLMHPRDRLEYTQGLRYFLGVQEQRAIERFQGYLDQLKSH